MKKEINFVFPPDIAFDAAKLRLAILKKEGFPPHAPLAVKLLRRSIDARQRDIKVNITAEIALNEPLPPFNTVKREYQNVSQAPAVIVVGCGPAGIFAALRLIELGLKPIVLERGKDVRARRRDLAAINKDHTVNAESNYCFGEGGAGTYSDGKLYTRSHKRGHIRDILETLVEHGATTDILIDSHPHIGTNKLPQIVAELRQSILSAGGEVRFETKVSDFIYKEGHILGVVTASGEEITGEAVILATGHSARDIFELLHKKQIKIEAKPFALGVRVEHPQSLIDKIQYRCEDRGDYLPAASYALVHQADTKAGQKGVFSFCMCPGGFIVPSATAPGEVVVNRITV